MTERDAVALGLQSAAMERTAAWEKRWRAGTTSRGCVASRAQAEAADAARAGRGHLPDEVGHFRFRNHADPEGRGERGAQRTAAPYRDQERRSIGGWARFWQRRRGSRL